MEKIIITNIKWDTEGQSAKSLGLPTQTVMETDNEDLIREVNVQGYCEDIENWLSDSFGWCVKSFNADLENNLRKYTIKIPSMRNKTIYVWKGKKYDLRDEDLDLGYDSCVWWKMPRWHEKAETMYWPYRHEEVQNWTELIPTVVFFVLDSINLLPYDPRNPRNCPEYTITETKRRTRQ